MLLNLLQAGVGGHAAHIHISPSSSQCHGLLLFNKVVQPSRPLYDSLNLSILTHGLLHPYTRSFTQAKGERPLIIQQEEALNNLGGSR